MNRKDEGFRGLTLTDDDGVEHLVKPYDGWEAGYITRCGQEMHAELQQLTRVGTDENACPDCRYQAIIPWSG